MSDQKALLQRALAAIDTLTDQLHEAESRAREPIAVVGMSCRFPGGAADRDAYWRLLREGRSGIVEIPADRWDVEAFYDPALSQPGTMYTKRGGFIDGVDGFDAAFFRISPREAATLDPQHRLLLECTWEALEDAGEAPDRLVGSETGVFVGITASDYGRLMRIGREDSDVYSATGTALNAAAGRLSFFLGLQGPCMAIDTACSSSLVAAHEACQALRAGECERAIVGGVNVMLSPEPFVLFSHWGMISSSGECRAFDRDASGFVRGEGCGVLVLKRLSDAVAAGDRIDAVILGSAVNQDGPSSGLSVPNGPAQVKVIRTALARAGVEPAEIGYVETHGTGTPIGDPIEVEALGEAYGRGRSRETPLLIGSVKASIGHLESAAGVASLIKLVLAVRNGELPPQLSYDVANPRIAWDRMPIRVVEELRAWPAGTRPVGAVSGFGFSGTNVHMVVAAPPEGTAAPTSSPTTPVHAHVLPLAARSPAALAASAANLARWLETHPEASLSDVARTLATGRARFSERAVVVGRDPAALIDRLGAVADGRAARGTVRGSVVTSKAPPVAFLYSGQGAQYPGMGLELSSAFPVYREAFGRCADLIERAGGPDLRALLDSGAVLDATAVTQPALFAVEYALTELLASWGIRPAAVLGHSVGEITAACVAGVFSLEDAAAFISTRGRLMQALPSGGGMLAVQAPPEVATAAAAAFSDRVSLAAINGPRDSVLSGDVSALERISATLEAQGFKTKALRVSHAFHSPLMEPMLADWARALEGFQLRKPSLPVVSNLSGTFDPEAGATPEYWRRHVRAPVAFERSMRAAAERGLRVFVEIGPRPVLLGMARSFLEGPDTVWIPTLRARSGEAEDALEALGALWAAGAVQDWEPLLGRAGRKVRLPTYPFQRTRHWAAARPLPPGPTRAETPRGEGAHPLLGRLVSSPLAPRQFECTFDPARTPLLAEHCISGMPVFPASGYIELARAAATELWGSGPVRLEGVRFHAALVLGRGSDEGARAPLEVRLVVTPTGERRGEFEVFSREATTGQDAPWTRHVSGQLAAGRSDERREPLEAGPCPEAVDVAAYQEQIAALGLQYGASFRALIEAAQGPGAATGRVRLPEGSSSAPYGVHPGLLDAVFHLIGLARSGGDEESFLLPVGFAEAEVLEGAGGEILARCAIREEGAARVVADISMSDPEGRRIGHVIGLETRPLTQAQFAAVVSAAPRLGLMELRWEHSDAPAPGESTAGEWLVLTRSEPVAAPIVEALAASGASARWVGPVDVARLLERREPLGAAGVIDLRAAEWQERHHAPGDESAQWSADALLSGPLEGPVELLSWLARHPGPAGLRIVLVTCGSQRVRPDERPRPAGATLWGIGATAALELVDHELALLDVDQVAGEAAGIAAVARAERVDRFALRAGECFRERLARNEPTPARSGTLQRLEAERRGDLTSLALKPAGSPSAGPGQVLVEVLASGLNFRDVLNALDMYPGEPGPLGNECCGRIMELGAGVEDLAVGDLVTCIAEDTFASRVVAERAMVFRVPPELSIAQAAAFPIAQLTATLALDHLGQLGQGEYVLIHAAAGGVGLAAVHLALARGAKVLATAGSEEKRALLLSLGVERVWDSRTVLPAHEVMEATGGRGADIVLNALIGASIDEGIRALAPGGRFLEIGLRDVREPADVAALRPDVSYVPILLGDWCRSRPEEVRELWTGLVDLLARGEIPAPRVRRFRVEDAAAAFQHMARGRHVGRIVLTHPQNHGRAIRRDSAYLVTGGLGALGLHVADWLASAGARHLVLAGRRAPTAEAAARIAALRARGAEVHVLAADVSEADPLTAIRALGIPPIRGVVHAAGVTDDASLGKHDAERLRRVLTPKVDGARRVLDALSTQDLDFAVFFSSGSAVLGSPGQAAYAGANAFLDALAGRLAADGGAATSISWGAWAGEGMASAVDARTLQQWSARGIGRYTPVDGVAVLDEVVGGGDAHVLALLFDWPRFLASLDPVPPLYEGLLDTTAGRDRPSAAPGESLAALLRAVPPRERPAAAAERIRAEVAGVLGMSDPHQLEARRGFTEQGMDSLMAVELATRLGRLTGVTLPSTFIFDHPTLDALVRHLLLEVMPESAQGAQDGRGTASEAGREAIAVLEGLSDETLEAELRLELDRMGF